MLSRCFAALVRLGIGEMFLHAFGANAMAELGIGVFHNIFFEPLPTLFVVSYLMAVHAGGQDSPERFNMLEGILQLLDSFGKSDL